MPKEKFITIGKGKVVHVVRTKAADIKAGVDGSQCPTVRKAWVAGTIKPSVKGVSPEAAMALDECSRCHTHDVAKAVALMNESPEEKRAKARDKRDEVLERAKGKSKAKPKSKDKPVKADKAPKEPKAPSMTKSGPRSTGSGETDKAEQLVAFAKEHGWKATLEKDDQHWRVTAVRGAETINVWYIDGKYDIGRHAEVVVGNWSGKLRGAHQARRQMANEGRDRPHPEPGRGRSGPRKKSEDEAVPADESPEDARRRVPFAIDDDAPAIIDVIKGKTIKWRNGTTKQIEEAMLPDKANGKKRPVIQITDHPKGHTRILEFLSVEGMTEDGPIYGPQRFVALDKIIRVIG
jgi:hypothetical protein